MAWKISVLLHATLSYLAISGTGVNGAIFSPILPPSYPLAVRSPYLSAWVPGNQVANLATATPQFWKGLDLSWSVLARVDGTTYKLFGTPAALSGSVAATLTHAEYTSSHSIFTLAAGEATTFTLDFFSPVSPKNYVRQSLPFSYLTVSVHAKRKSNVQVYSDIDETWTGQTGNTAYTFTTSNGVAQFELSVKNAIRYTENDRSQALWGQTVLAAKASVGVKLSHASGTASALRTEFASNGSLSDTTPAFTRGNVVAFSQDLGSVRSGSITFGIGYVREAAINYLGNPRTGYYRSKYPDTPSALSFFFNDYADAYAESLISDKLLEHKALAAAGTNYSDILLLTTRQVYGGSDLTIPHDTLDTSDVMVFLKEISSNGNVNTLDVIFPAFPIWYVMNPEYIRLLLEPVLQYFETGRWKQPFAIHDLGTHYPNATGHDDQIEEDMPVEESGNLILLAYAYITATGNTAWGQKYLHHFTKYADYLVTGGLDQPIQLATNDCCGPLANQTNLAIKAAIALNAYGKLFNAANYSSAGLGFANEIYTNGLGLDSARTHFKLQYGTNVTFGKDDDFAVVFNIFPDNLFNLSTFPSSAFDMLVDYYPTKQGETGVPLDSRVNWSSTFWTHWTGAAGVRQAGGIKVRDLFINNVWAFITNGLNTAPFSDRWFAVPGRGGLIGGSGDLVGGYNAWRNRPIVGGHFAVLALNGPNQF